MATGDNVGICDFKIRQAVVKCSTDRLREEMENCQLQFDTDAISKLGRRELVAYVTLIRQTNGSNKVCKNLISDFDYTKALILNDDEKENKSSVVEDGTGGGDTEIKFSDGSVFHSTFGKSEPIKILG